MKSNLIIEKLYVKRNIFNFKTYLGSNETPKRMYDIPVLSGSTYIGQLYDAK